MGSPQVIHGMVLLYSGQVSNSWYQPTCLCGWAGKRNSTLATAQWVWMFRHMEEEEPGSPEGYTELTEGIGDDDGEPDGHPGLTKEGETEVALNAGWVTAKARSTTTPEILS